MDISKLNLPVLSQSDSAFNSRYFAEPNLNSSTAQALQCTGETVDYPAPQLPVPQLQCGGGNYNYILNPLTNKQVKLTSKSGKRILKAYLSFLTGGSGMESIFNPNMETRKFDCSQPTWEPACI
tara:strand:- start:166 stop:537 length:372 start_codon:yes stop_codon:yes gene_type:complete